MPTIQAIGVGVAEWGTSTDCANSRNQARINARASLRARATRFCPGGYSITAGPTYKTEVDCEFGLNGWWPDLTSTVRITATITCNNSGQLPFFAFVEGGSDQDELYAGVLAWKDHYNAVISSYEELALIDTAGKMQDFLERTGREQELTIFTQAVEAGRAEVIVPPALNTFLTNAPFGGALAPIVEADGISAIDAFLKDLDVARQSAQQVIRKGLGSSCDSGIVNININL